MTKEGAIEAPGRGQTKQLERAFDAINALIQAAQPLKLNALAEVTRLDASGTLKLLKTLVDLGYVVRDEARKTYLPSAKALFPMGLFHPIQELRRDATDLLLDIQRATSATSALQIFLGGQRVVVEQRHGSSRLTPYWDTTVSSAYHSSSSGKLYLSTLSLAERREIAGPGPYPRFTASTLVDFKQLEADIQASLARGFFMAKEEAFSGMSSVAAPVRVPNGSVIGALIATGTTGQLPTETLEQAAMVVKKAADMLSSMSPAVRALEPLLGRNGAKAQGRGEGAEHQPEAAKPPRRAKAAR